MNRKVARLVLWLLLATGIALAILYRDRFDVAIIQQWVDQAGDAAPLLFIGIYALGAVLFLPGSVLTLAGGALFGPVLGTLYNLAGATIGAALAFLAARYLASDWVERRAGGRLRQLKEGVEHEGWRFVAFTRLVPLFPYNLLNYALGLTKIRFLHYLVATCICMVPGAIAYTYLGYAGREAVGGGEGLVQKILLALALLAAVAFLPRLIGRLRQRPWLDVRALKELVDGGSGLVVDVRTAADFNGEQGHIRGALNLPLEDLESRLEELGDDLQRPIAIVCRTDRRSAKAASLLARRGFGDARVVRGGMTAWLENRWPVERIEPRME